MEAEGHKAEMSLTQSALWLAQEMRLPVFACGPDKRPVTQHGFHDATRDPAEIRTQFGTPGAAMIGVPTGQGAGFFVVDLDVKNGGQGLEWLAANQHRLPRTRTHKTRSGGQHLLFQWPEGRTIRNSASRVAPGVDVRGNGGYIIAPPSPDYEIADASALADAPPWLLALIDPPAAPRATDAPRPAPAPRQFGDGTRYGLTALDNECQAILSAADGAKHDTLNRAAFSIGGLVAAGELAEGPAMQALASALAGIASRCEDFPAAQKTLGAAFRAGMAKPREAPTRLVRRIVEEYRETRPEPPPLDHAPDHWSAEPDFELPSSTLEPERVAPSAGKSPLWVDNAAFNAAAIPRRPWAVPGYLMRGSVTVLSGQGAGGKSSLVVRWTINAATGQAIGQFIPSAPLKVVNYNTEDDRDEQQRRYSAALKASGHDPDVMQNIIRCGPEDVGTLFERDQATGRITQTAAMAQLEELCVSTDADVLFCDPLAELHNAEENDNTAMRAVVAAFRSLAKRLNIAVVILHHDRKGNSSPGDMDRVRGASAISGAVRVMLTLTTMTEEEADKLGIRPEDRRRHFRIDGAKSNYAPPQEAEWWRLAAYEIENGEQIAACMPWQAPSPWAGLQWDQITKIIAEIEAGPGRAGALWMVDKKGAFWAGHVLMKHSNLNEKQAGVLLKAWEANGVLQHEPFTNEKGNERNGYTVNRTKFSEMRQQKEAA
jgi:hypothetical protein